MSTGLVTLATERTTAATDLLLALVVAGGMLRLRRAVPPGWRRGIWLLALAAFGSSALIGAVVHGLALGGSLENAVVVDDFNIVNPRGVKRTYEDHMNNVAALLRLSYRAF